MFKVSGQNRRRYFSEVSPKITYLKYFFFLVSVGLNNIKMANRLISDSRTNACLKFYLEALLPYSQLYLIFAVDAVF